MQGTIPPEILSKIFTHVDFSRNTSTTHGVKIKTRLAQYTITCVGFQLALVCRYWHAVSLATPSLWASVGVIISCGPYRQGFLEMLSMVLSRSGSAKLSIIMDVDRSLHRVGLFDSRNIVGTVTGAVLPSDSRNAIPACILRLLFEQSERISHLVFRYISGLELVEPHILVPLLLHYSSRLKTVTNLALDGLSNNTSTSHVFKQLPQLLQLIPSISNLQLRLCTLSPRAFQDLSLSSVHLTQLSVQDITTESMWHFLRYFTNLRSATFTLDSIPPSEFQAHAVPEVCCQYLHSFTVLFSEIYPNDSISLQHSPFMSAICLPSLESLTLGTDSGDTWSKNDWQAIKFFEPFIARSANGLRTFKLDSFPIDFEAATSVFEMMPNLRELVVVEMSWREMEKRSQGSPIQNPVVNKNFMSCLVDPDVLPQLEHLRLYVNFGWEGTDLFETMVEARKFKSTYLQVLRRSVDLDLPRLQRLIDKGIVVKVEEGIEAYGRTGTRTIVN
ncbi:hypothetical protein VNI00_014798 [Paramarasmius palmivorus]|uniref:F-box domain-containing protein n=1 Tax=Paramarasmius palmivorus TaxID=297713 RepID=A0AAW0BQG9_9AGAR